MNFYCLKKYFVKWNNPITTLLVLCSLVVYNFPLKASPKEEIRAVWLTTYSGLDWPKQPVRSTKDILKQQQEIIRQLDEAQKLNLNMVFFQTRARGDVFYPSAIEPWNPVLTDRFNGNPGYDPLRFVIEACHQRGMECHAWLVCMPIGKVTHVNKHGKNSVVKKRPELCKQFKDEWYLNPGHPETKKYLAEIAVEIVKKYPIDGIHLDYIRYPDDAPEFPDKDTYKRYSKSGVSLSAWRRENINETVKTIYSEVKKANPNVIVSTAVLGRYNSLPTQSAMGWSGIERVHQDAKEWMQNGYVDMVVPMLYYKDRFFYPFAEDWLKGNNSCSVVYGLAPYRVLPQEGNWELSVVTNQMDFERRQSSRGVCFFRMEHTLSNDKGVRDTLFHRYKNKALIPPYAHLNMEYPEKISELNIQSHWKDFVIQWPQVKGAKSYIVYGSKDTIVDTTNPQNILSVVFTNRAFIPKTLPFYRWIAVSASNAAHIEGEAIFWDMLSNKEFDPKDNFGKEVERRSPKLLFFNPFNQH